MSSRRDREYDDLMQDDDDELFDTPDPQNPQNPHNQHASDSRWRHQESSAFRRAARPAEPDSSALRHAASPAEPGHAREPEARGRVTDLADFLNSSRISPEEIRQERERQGSNAEAPRFRPVVAAAADAAKATSSRPGTSLPPQGPPPDGKDILVGPLLNYRRMEGERWFGSVLVVVKGGGKTQPFQPTLVVGPSRQAGGDANGGQLAANTGRTVEIDGLCLYSDPRNTFWRFDVGVDVQDLETKWEYSLPGLRHASKAKRRHAWNFFVPAKSEAMRIMFHSCNGFSVGTDEDAWCGPALWNDVNRVHAETPFHVMIGGGDQIYNDNIRVSGPLRQWTDISNPKKRRDYPFPEMLRQECDDFYLQNYVRWYSTEPFASANGQIPQLNIWDDHDIIDGFGSYVHDFMMCDVFRGIGGTAHKYYMLFQHHLPPPASTYTSDLAPTTSHEEGQGVDPNQMVKTYVHPAMTESNYIVGSKPGPYVAEHSHNMFAKLGARVAFLGIDARTERTRHQVNYPETYDQIFDRLRQELSSEAQRGTPYRHLILLLGIPIAYPRLTWLENIFASPVIGPVKFLNRRFGLGGSVFNKFDGGVDLLDDLDDHYTASTHKKERNELVWRLQDVCAEFSVRITILGGDVHLAALGRFYSNPALGIPTENDHRFMVNVVSSAITNKPPPAAIANLLARRNKIHHLDAETDETLLKLFDKDPGNSSRTAGHNRVTMPSRNYTIITENSPNNAAPGEHAGDAYGQPPTAPPPIGQQAETLAPPSRNGQASSSIPPGSSAGASTYSGGGKGSSSGAFTPGQSGHHPLHPGEAGCGSGHKATALRDRHGRGNDGSLDVCIRVEVDQHNPEGVTEGYGLSIPALTCRPATAGGASVATSKRSRRQAAA